MEIRVCLQELWLRCHGTFHCSIYFTLANTKIESKPQGECATKIVKDGKCWKLGPIADHTTSDVINDLQSLEFMIDCINEPTSFPAAIHLDLYQEIQMTNPSTSQDNTAETRTNLVLMGKGNLQLVLPQTWHSSITEYDKGTYHHRVSINSTQAVGSINFNLGWLGITTLFQQITAQDAVEELADQILIANESPPVLERNDPESPEIPNGSISERLELSRKANEIKPTSFAFFEPKDNLPSVDAVHQILPMYYKLTKQPPQRKDSVKPYLPVNEPEETNVVSQDSHKKPIDSSSKSNIEEEFERKKSLDNQVMSVLEYQTKELDRYRQAIRQMGELVVSLRNQVSELQMKNSELRSSIYYAGNSSHPSAQQDGFPSARKALIDEIEVQKAMLQKQQNDLIAKNEYEKKYLKLLKAHQSQQSLLQDLQVKLSKYQRLEKICKKQEKIIIELETSATKSIQRKKTSENTSDKPVRVSFQDERGNTENVASMEISRRILPYKPEGNIKFEQFGEVEDRVVLLQKLEKAEGRIMALERQVLDNARLWAREKSQLKVKHFEGFPDMIDMNRGLPATLALPSNQMDHFNQNFYQFPTMKKHDLYSRFSQL